MLIFACFTPLASWAADVSSWDDLKTVWASGVDELKLTADVTVPVTQGDASLAGLVVEQGRSLLIDGRSSGGVRFRLTGMAESGDGYGVISRAFYGKGGMNISSCWFDGNYVALASPSDEAKGGAVHFGGRGEFFLNDCLFTGNRVLVDPEVAGGTAAGGAVYAGKGFFRNVTFQGNHVGAASGAFGGAVSGEGNLSLEDCRFFGNYTLKSTMDTSLGMSCGGGLYYKVKEGVSSTLEMTARESDFIFRGNVQNAARRQDGQLSGGMANSVYIKSVETSGMCDVHFRASSGKSLLFYDPVFFDVAPGAPRMTVYLNKTDGENNSYTGRVVFSGEDYLESGREEDRISYCTGSVSMIQNNGAVIIRDGAVLGLSSGAYGGAQEEGSPAVGMEKYVVQKGILEISSRGRLLTETLSFEGGAGKCTWRAGGGARLDTKLLDMSRGVTLDLRPWLDTGDSGMQIYADNVRLGGFLNIEDKYNEKGLESLDFYMNSRWASKQKYLVFDFLKQSDIQGDFMRVVSRLSGDGSVNSPYGYQGKWTEAWEDSDGDAVRDKLYLVWTPAGSEPDPEDPEEPGIPNPPPIYPGIKDIHPEMAGTLAVNSLWSATAGIQASSRVALDRLDISRFRSGNKQSYYVSGLGVSDSNKGDGSVDGYDCSGYGWSVGADMLFGTPNRVGGIAFGNVSGKNKSRNYSSDVDTYAHHATLYYGWLKDLDSDNLLKVTGSISYGLTDNRLETYYSDGRSSWGSWNVTSTRLTLGGEWSHILDANWTLSAFAGLEFDDAVQEDFLEYGERVRSFNEAKMANLALPLGAGIHREDEYDGIKWHHHLSLSLVPDIYRKDPEAKAVFEGNGFTWMALGTERERFSFRLDYSTRLQIDVRWSLFAGYSMEGRGDAFYQMVNAGIGLTF